MPDLSAAQAGRAVALLQDYAYQLDRGRLPPRLPAPTDSSSSTASGALLLWEKHRLAAWAAAGRLAPDGLLRVALAPLAPYTLSSVGCLWPQLNRWDRLAALIDLDGVVEEGYMDAHENIRAVVEKLADERLVRALQEPAAQDRLKELVEATIGEVFGVLLGKIKHGRHGVPWNKGKNKCSKCGVSGHSKRTCASKAKADV